MYICVFFFFKQKTAYEMRISDWSSDVCSSDLLILSTWVIGERSSSSCLPSSVRGSPTRLYHCSMKLAQYAGKVLNRVTRLDGPTRSTPQAKVSGVKVMPTRVA